MIQIEDDLLKIQFDRWDQAAYRIFLQSKALPEHDLSYDWQTDSYMLTAPARFAHVFGIEAPAIDRGWLAMSSHLFDFQAFTARVALDAKRYACWWLTGLGKTHLQWELARQIVHKTGNRVLIIVPLNIITQTLRIGAKYFELPAVTRLESRETLRQWCSEPGPGIGIVNPEKFIPRKGESEVISEVKRCAGVLLDEASILAAGRGVIKWALIKSCRGVEYKYTFTATPARNDVLDYASQASFLEKIRSEGEVLWTYFQRDKEGEWKLKKHAEAAFYRFMSGWSMYLINPVHYGFSDYLKDLPPPTMIEHKIPLTKEQRRMIAQVPDPSGQLSLFGNRPKLTLAERSRYSQIAKGFLYRDGQEPTKVDSLKPTLVADLVRTDAAEGLQPLVWTVFDEESSIIMELLRDNGLKVGVLHGKIPKSKRPSIIEAYRMGELDVLVSKASLLGFGLNFQNCGSMIFSGFDDSFEKQFQAVRRAYRYGQTRSVKIHIPYIPELEGVVWANVQQKQTRYDMETRIMESNYREALRGLLKQAA